MADESDTVKVRVDSSDAESGLNRIERASKSAGDALLSMGVAGQSAFDRLTRAISDGSAFKNLQSGGQSAFATIQQSAQLAFESIQTNLSSIGGSAFNTLRSVGLQAFGDIRQAAQNTFAQVSGYIQSTSAGSSIGALKNTFDATFDSIKARAADAAAYVKSTLSAVGNASGSLFNSLAGPGTFANSSFGALKTSFDSVADAIKSKATDTAAYVKSALAGAQNVGSSLVGSLVGPGTQANSVFQSLRNTAQSAFDAIRNQATQAGSVISSAFGASVNTVKNLFSSFGNTSAVANANQAVTGFRATLSTLGSTLGSVTSGFTTSFSNISTGASNALGTTKNFLVGIASGIENGAAGFAAFARAAEVAYTVVRNVFIGMEAVFDHLLDSLKSLQGFFAGLTASYGSGAAGAERAGQDYDFLRSVSNQLGVEFESLLKNFARLSTSIPDSANKASTLRNVFTGLADAARTFHLTQAQTNTAFLAIDELASRGVASLTLFRRQLGQQLPGVLEGTAAAIGTTTAKLEAQISKGNVDSIKLLEVMGPVMIKMFSESGQQAAQSVDSSINRIKNLFTDFAKSVLDSGGAAAIASVFDVIREKLSDSTVIETGTKLVADLATQIRDFIRTVSAEDISQGFHTFITVVEAVTTVILKLLGAINQLVNFIDTHQNTLTFIGGFANFGVIGGVNALTNKLSAEAAKEQGLPDSNVFGSNAPTLAFPQRGGSVVGVGGVIKQAPSAFGDVDLGVGKDWEKTASEKVSEAITKKITDALGTGVDLSGLSKLTSGIRANSDSLTVVTKLLASPTLKTSADKLKALQAFSDTGVYTPPVAAPTTLGGLLTDGKQKKGPRDSGEEYIKTLQNQLGIEEKLSAVQTLQAKIAEGQVKFKTDAAYQDALSLALTIDQGKATDYLEKLKEAGGKKVKDRTDVEKLDLDIQKGKVNFLSAQDLVEARKLATASDQYKAQEKLLKALDDETKIRSSLNEVADRSLREFGTKVADVQSQISNVGGDPFQASQAKALNDGLKSINNTVEQLQNDALHHPLIPGLQDVADNYGPRAIALLTQLIAKNQELHDKSLEAGTGVAQFYTQISLELQDKAKIANGVLNDLLNETTNAFNTLITTGKFSFSDFARSVIEDLEKVIAKMLILQAFKGIGDLLQGTPVAGAFNSVVDLIGGGASKAAGAAVGSLGATAADTALTTLATTSATVDTAFGTLFTTTGGVETGFGTLVTTTGGVDTGFGTLTATSVTLDGSFGTVVAAAGFLTSALYAAATAAGASSAGQDVGGAAQAFELFDAKGDAWSGGSVVRFAAGGVFDSPHVFKMANGGIGMLGEAGPEAVMPLARGSGGKLGVVNHDGSGSGAPVYINTEVTVNSDGSSEVTSDKETGAQLGRVINAAIQTWVSDNMRPGGQLQNVR